MMTFILLRDFVASMALLNQEHLGKQRLEAATIIDMITHLQQGDYSKVKHNKYYNHVTVNMWYLYLDALKYYYNCCLSEWVARGYKNDMPFYDLSETDVLLPWWLDWPPVIESHRAMVVRKDPTHYGSRVEVNPRYADYGYIWPCPSANLGYQLNYTLVEVLNADLQYLASPIPKEIANAKYCDGVFKTGKKKGQVCGHIVLAKGQTRCGKHREAVLVA